MCTISISKFDVTFEGIDTRFHSVQWSGGGIAHLANIHVQKLECHRYAHIDIDILINIVLKPDILRIVTARK